MSGSQDSSTKLSNLPQPRRLITTHNEEGKAIVHSADDFQWQPFDKEQMGFSVVYTTSSFPPDLNEDRDIKANEKLIEKGTGLVNPGGTIIRCVDFRPGYACMMHRTQSLE
jgi:hypothetical protein